VSSVDERLRPDPGGSRPDRPLPRLAGPAPGHDEAPPWDEYREAERYAVRPVRPLAQLAARVGLWTLVGLGCLGGVLALVRPSGSDPAVEASTAEEAIPAPVVRVAELVVEEWLTATGDDRDRLDVLFVEPPSLGDAGAGVAVERVTSLAGRQVAEDYWAVTVAADVVETPLVGVLVEGGAGGESAATTIPEEGSQPAQTRWYVEVGIVGDEERGLAALTTPAVMPLPPTLPDDTRVLDVSPSDAEPGDPVTEVVEGFLGAMLTGAGDPTRYLAPGVSMTPADPPPFFDVRVEQIVSEPLGDDSEIWILAHVVATTPGGAERRFTYDLYAVAAVDRWEIVALSGVPTRTVQAATDAGAGS
jgi:hypothetical protein